MVNLKLFASLILITHIGLQASASVPKAFMDVGQSTGIEGCLLYAIAMQESATALTSGKTKPWPWTINMKGNSFRFNDKQDAIIKVKSLLSINKNIDIGLMQINYYWHRQRFDTLDDMFDPMLNLKMAAVIFNEGLKITKETWKAVGYYHSPGNVSHSTIYTQKVKSKWEKYCL